MRCSSGPARPCSLAVAALRAAAPGLPPQGRTQFRFKLNFMLWRSAVKCFSRSMDIQKLFQDGCIGE